MELYLICVGVGSLSVSALGPLFRSVVGRGYAVDRLRQASEFKKWGPPSGDGGPLCACHQLRGVRDGDQASGTKLICNPIRSSVRQLNFFERPTKLRIYESANLRPWTHAGERPNQMAPRLLAHCSRLRGQRTGSNA